MKAFVHTDIINYSIVSKKLTRNNVDIVDLICSTSITSGQGNFTSVDINGGTIDGVTIGATAYATLINSRSLTIKNLAGAYNSAVIYENGNLALNKSAIFTGIFLSPLASTLSYFNGYKMVFGAALITHPTAKWEFVGGTNIIGALTCTSTINCGALTATNINFTGGSIIAGVITGTGLALGAGNITTTGTLHCGTTSITGNSFCSGNATINGLLTCGAISSGDISLGVGNITTTGTIGCGTITTTGIIGGAGGISSSGHIAGASVAVGGAISGASLNVGSGAITAGSLNVGTGDVSGEDITGSATISAPQCICGSLTLDTDIVETVAKHNPVTGVKFISKITTTSWAGKIIKKIDINGAFTGTATGSFDLSLLGITTGFFIEVNLVGKLLPVGNYGVLRFSSSVNPGSTIYRSMLFAADPVTLSPYYAYNTSSSDTFGITLGVLGVKTIFYNNPTPDRLLIQGTITAFQHN